MKEIFVPERNEKRSYEHADSCKKLIQKNKETILFSIYKSVNPGTEWNFAEGSQECRSDEFFAFKDVVHQEDEGNQILPWQPTNGTCTETVQNQQHKFCYLPEIWVSVQLHLKHFIHCIVSISCVLYPHIYTCHSERRKTFSFIF